MLQISYLIAGEDRRERDAAMEELKLVAVDKDDMVVSAHVQDALVKVADIFWQPREHRFVMALNRFAASGMTNEATRLQAVRGRCAGGTAKSCERRRIDDELHGGWLILKSQARLLLMWCTAPALGIAVP
jgi:hypothetical protein